MKNSNSLQYWLSRVQASDPGRKRLNQASKATLSLILSVFTVLLIINLANGPQLTPAIMGGIAGMLGILVVNDDTEKEKKLTTILLIIPAILGVTLGAILAWNVYLISLLMIGIIFSAFYFTKYGTRYFSIFMIAFITVYFASFLQLPAADMPWFYGASMIGLIYAYFHNFILFKSSSHILRRSMSSFHRQANLTFDMLIDLLKESKENAKSKKRLSYNVSKLREYAGHVSTDLNAHDVQEIWPGLTTKQLKLYIFDTAMLVATLNDSLQQLKKNDALETDEIRQLVVRVISSLQQADVLAENYDEKNLAEAQSATKELKQTINKLFQKQTNKPEGWLFLLRRIESIANHVTYAALTIQRAKNHPLPAAQVDNKLKEKDDKELSDSDSENTGELKPSTKKAFQALVAGSISIAVGYAISPVQPYWVVLTSFIVLLGTQSVGRIYQKGLRRSIGTVVGAVIGFFLAQMVSGNSQLEVFLLFTVVFFAFYLLTVSYTMMSVFITMLIAFMYDLLLGGISFSLLGARVVDTITGAAIALIVSSFLLPTKTRDKVNESFKDYLTELEEYLTQYIRSFTQPIQVKELTDHAFTLDEKLTAIQDEADPILNNPLGRRMSELPRWITIFTAINYYSSHLIASSYQKNLGYPKEVRNSFPLLEEKIIHNLRTVRQLLDEKDPEAELYTLTKEREQIERAAPLESQHHIDLVHHVYYIWRINQSLMLLGEKLGAKEKAM
ncbi:FUSC family protein [Halobacillus sp. Marseille-Q1614]|uniref:FUSC family protein n=1 Tax=Halobacillus sp. Marseille-Q1614 TaxID=2709134 RepID=UPI0015700B86|nr:FUSC family protein [Halobacillus sp. Marseille-Q1614]